MEQKRILVTGGTGLVGQALQRILPDAYFVSSTDYDLTVQSEVQRMYRFIRPTHVIHLAARVGGIFDNISHPSQYFEENVMMNTNMVKYARECGVQRFIGILSSCIFPAENVVYPMNERELHLGPPTPTNFSYGMAKRAMAIQIDMSNKEYGTQYNYISPCNLYGLSDKDDIEKSHFVTALIKKIYLANKNNESFITLFGNGTPLRQFMHADDLANVLKIVIDNDITESFNLATEENFSIDTIARIALKTTNSEHLDIKYDTSKPNGQHRKDLSILKFKDLIPGYKFITLKDGIKQSYDVMKEKLDK